MTTILEVDTTADQNDGNADNGLSLREAILIANANPDTEYEIHLQGGETYRLTANGNTGVEGDLDLGVTGDLDISSRNNVLYIGAFDGEKATIDASGLLNSDRVFNVLNGGTLSLQNVIVTGGNPSGDGGGIKVEANGFLDLYNARVQNNAAISGGGIENNREGTVVLRNGSTVSNNNASALGGGISNSGFLKTVNSTISNNTVADDLSFSGGGGIYNSSTITLINTTVSGNSSRKGGGIYSSGNVIVGASVALVNTTIGDNSAKFSGGGIHNTGESIINTFNSTITNNTITVGSDILAGGGGIFNFDRGSVNLKNTIVTGNFDMISSFTTRSLAPDLSGSFNGNNYNLIGDLQGASGTVGTGTDIVNPNPQLSPLQDNGGDILTYALLDGSPAIDAGSNDLIVTDTEDLDGDGDTTELIPFDGRGFERLVGDAVDIGAVEAGADSVESVFISIDNITITEGNSDTTEAIFTVTLDRTATETVTVEYATADDTATANSDYTASNGTLEFAPGETSKTIAIEISGDAEVEEDETFFVNLSNATNATITNDRGLGTIANDDDSETNSKPNLTFGSLSNDGIEIPATDNPTIVFTGTSDDEIETTLPFSEAVDRFYSGSGIDTIIAGTNDRLFGGEGNDLLSSTDTENRLYGGEGDDELFAGMGNNVLIGGEGSDRFSILNDELPEFANRVVDFSQGEDVIVLKGFELGFDDLNLRQENGDTVVNALERDLVILLGINSNSLTVEDFVFSS